ncbi:MAG: DUF1573 domain-containing protein [Candidatus Sungbacteria bacterium]|nr:DUF1573 domain-containing protein [Candidatus Sungbacteria bacterium]
MNKITIGIAAGVIAFAGIVWAMRPSPEGGIVTPSVSGSTGAISAEEKDFDFGTVSMAAGNVSHLFRIKNTGQESVVIEKMYTSCMCTSATLEVGGKVFGPYGMPGHGFSPSIKEAIASGAEAVVNVVFDPAAHGPAGIGRIHRAIIIENNAGEPLKLGFTVLVTP